MNLGHSGVSWTEAFGVVALLGGFGGAIGGGLRDVRSSSSDTVEPVSDGGLGGGMEGGSKSPKNSGGGGMNWGGGGGGATEGGGGIRISPSSGSATLIMPPLASFSVLPVHGGK